MIKSGQAIGGEFTLTDADGALVDADSLPTAVLVVDGVDTGTTVTITNKETGVYKWASTAPTCTAGQRKNVQVRVAATIDTVDTGDDVWEETAVLPEAGAGEDAQTYTVTDADSGLGIPDADVWITSDIDGANVIAAGQTDANGEVVLYPDVPVGTTVYVWRRKTGSYVFSNPDTEVTA